MLKTTLNIVDPAILVPPIAETYASLRWIHLYQCTGAFTAKTQLWSLLKLARKQSKGWEVLCHPLVLLFYQVCPSQNSGLTIARNMLKVQIEILRSIHASFPTA